MFVKNLKKNRQLVDNIVNIYIMYKYNNKYLIINFQNWITKFSRLILDKISLS